MGDIQYATGLANTAFFSFEWNRIEYERTNSEIYVNNDGELKDLCPTVTQNDYDHNEWPKSTEIFASAEIISLQQAMKSASDKIATAAFNEISSSKEGRIEQSHRSTRCR